MDAPWWVSLIGTWLPFLVLILVWIILSRYGAKGRSEMVDLYKTQAEEMRHTNALLERIALALEKRAAPTQ